MTGTDAAPEPNAWVMAIAPYVAGKAKSDDGRQLIKLSANESALGTSRAARQAFIKWADEIERYPDPSAVGLRDAIAARYDLDPARIIYGTGSDEVLHLIAGAYAGPGDEVIHVRYGFSVYEIAAKRVGATVIVAPDRDYATDVDAILAAVTPRTRIVYVANPNNPTGTFTPRAEIERLHANLPSNVMLVDDLAYAEYMDDPDADGGMTLAKTKANVIATRTFSKIYGLASARIGWGYGPAQAIEAMHRIRAPFNFANASEAAAIAALADTEFVEHARSHNARWRAWFVEQIESLGNSGLRAVPSQANFVLVLFEGAVTAERAYKELMDAGYIVRWLPGQGLPHGLRMTIGTEADTRGLAEALRKIVAEAR